MKKLGLAAALAAVAAIAGCRGLSEPDDVEVPTYHPSIQQSLLQEVRFDPPRGEDIQYMTWSHEDHRAMTPWTSSLEEAESKRRELASQHPLLNFTVLWRQHPAPTGGKLLVPTPNN
jgi:hypothetical protein